MRQVPMTFLRGFLMGAADIVPGVSGGTVALVVGIYRHLVETIRLGSAAIGHVLKLDFSGAVDRLRRLDWAFLISLLAGIFAAVLALSKLIETLLEDRPVEMAGLFLGLVAGSVVIAWKLLERRDLQRGVIVGVAAVVTFLLMGLRETTGEGAAADVVDPSLLIFFGAGAVAICAMILPGISGSFLLLSLGMYGPVLAVVNERDLLTVGVFLLGCVTGLALFSQLLHWALERHYDTVMAILIGLMVGSLRVLWPWPEGVDSTRITGPGDEAMLLPILLAGLGFVVVLGIERLGEKVEHRSVEDEVSDLRT